MLNKFKSLFCFAILFCFFECQANEKIYVKNTEKAHQVNAKIQSSNGDIESSTWFRMYLHNDNWVDVSSIHGDKIGVFFYESDIKNKNPDKCWGLEYHFFFKCDQCNTLQDAPLPPCMNPYCSSHNS